MIQEEKDNEEKVKFCLIFHAFNTAQIFRSWARDNKHALLSTRQIDKRYKKHVTKTLEIGGGISREQYFFCVLILLSLVK